MSGCDVASHRVSAVAVDATFALFEVDWVDGGVPVQQGVAPPMEVDAFLPDAGRGQHEGPEGAIEGLPDLRLASALLVLLASAVAQCEAGVQVSGLVGSSGLNAS